MGILRTTRVLWWLQRLDKNQHGGFLSAGLGLGHKDVDGYRGRLRSTRVLWWPGFCGGYRVWQGTTNMAFVA